MKNTPRIWLSGAAVMFGVALLTHSADLVFASMVPAALGVGSMLLSAMERWLTDGRVGDHGRIEQIEERLRLTESELDSAARELAAMKAKQEFDEQLLVPRSRPQE